MQRGQNTQSGSKSYHKRLLGYLILLIIAIVLLLLSWQGVKWDDFKASIKNCNWYWIGVAMLLGILGFMIRSLRWRMLLRQIDRNTTLSAAYRGVTIGNLANFAIPRIGEIVRCGIASSAMRRRRTTADNKEGLSVEGAIGTVIIERTWDLLCLLILATVFVLCSWDKFGEFIHSQIFNTSRTESGTSGVWLIITLTALVALIVAAIFTLYLKRKSLSKYKLFAKAGASLKKLWGGIVSAFKMRHKYLFFLLTALLWGSFVLTSKTTIMAIPAMNSLTWTDALFLMIIGSLGWAVPVQGGIGAYHFIVSLALVQVYATSLSEGIAFATISHESQAIIMILCGGISLILYYAQKSIEKREKDVNKI